MPTETNTGSVVISQTIYSIIREDGTGNFTSLNSWENIQQKIGMTQPEVALIDGPWNNADTTAVTIDGWSGNSATNTITIQTTSSARHDGKWNDSRYVLSVSSADNVLRTLESNTIIIGLQVVSTRGNSSTYYPKVILVSATNCLVDSCIVKMGNAYTHGLDIGIQCEQSGCVVTNCIAYDFLSNKTYTAAFFIDGAFEYYNCTAYNSKRGFYSYGTNAVLKNCLAQNCEDGFYLSVGASSCNNCSDIESDAPGSNPRTGNVLFVDEDADNFHLSPSDTVALGYGADLSATFTADIDGDTRTGAWDIGADQHTDEETTTTATILGYASIQSSQLINQICYAQISAETTSSSTLIGYFGIQSSQSQNQDCYFRVQTSQTSNQDGYFGIQTSQINNQDGYFGVQTSQTSNQNGYFGIQTSQTNNQDGYFNLLANRIETQVGFVSIITSPLQTQEGYFRIQASQLLAQVSYFNVQVNQELSQASFFNIQTNQKNNIDGYFRIQSSSVNDIVGYVEITYPGVVTSTILGYFDILANTAASQIGNANIQSSQNIDLDCYFEIQTSQTIEQTGNFRILAAQTNDIDASFDILASGSSEINGSVQITSAAIYTLDGYFSIAANSVNTIDGYSRILASQIQTIEGNLSIVYSASNDINGYFVLAANTISTILGYFTIYRENNDTIVKPISFTIKGFTTNKIVNSSKSNTSVINNSMRRGVRIR